jgi:hypothetical protein
MDANYMLACGIVWRKTADLEAGWELVEALESPDPSLRLLAQSLLVENGESSMDLLEGAVATGIVSPQAAGWCMAEILRIRATQTNTWTNSQAAPGRGVAGLTKPDNDQLKEVSLWSRQ